MKEAKLIAISPALISMKQKQLSGGTPLLTVPSSIRNTRMLTKNDLDILYHGVRPHRSEVRDRVKTVALSFLVLANLLVFVSMLWYMRHHAWTQHTVREESIYDGLYC